MGDSWRLALSPEADADLERVVAFIATQNPAAAERVGLELVSVIFSLATFPERGRPLLNRPKLRKLVHRYYLIIYRVDAAANLVEIVCIWDGRLDPSTLRLS